MTHYMNLNCRPFQMIKSGQKTIELRLWDEKRSLIKINDEIVFSCGEETITAKVLALHRFENYEALYNSLNLLKCGYLPEELDTAKADDMNEYYPPEKQQQYGVVGIEITLL
ncbi:MAG: ASCH domain-containing protein [Clostridia bacterium]|nr:ASCH domain-containing protein [Clostridia bacterium]MBQ3057854.1 ASCH domain-containing protein [Clostridia bacterium]